MLKVGLTGGIGAGKSTVAKVFNKLGVPVISSDKIAKQILNNDSIVKNRVINILGREAYLKDGTYNSKYVASQVFKDENLLLQLNSIIHPKVKIEIESWFESNVESDYCIEETALIEKSSFFDFIIYVKSNKDLKIERTLKRDKHRNREDVLAILEKQKSESEYLELADFVIDNDETQLVIPQVLSIDKKLKSSF